MKNTVIFDLDGTLVNSLQDLAGAANYMLDKMSMPKRSLDEVRSFVGNGIDMLVKRSVGNKEFDFNMAMSYFKEYYNENICNKTAPYPGMIDVISDLKSKGFRLCLVTNKVQWAAEKIADKFFKDSFDVVVGSDLALRKKKPDPEPVDYALSVVDSKRADAVYIGDSEVDIATAKNADMDFIGVTWGFRDKSIFKSTKYVANTPADIVTYCCNFL